MLVGIKRFAICCSRGFRTLWVQDFGGLC